MKYHIKNYAFTLAEVLITLGIIGIVAALVMPNLISNYREKQNIVKWKKQYSVFSQAYEKVKQDVGGDDALQDILDKTTWQDSSTITNLFLQYIPMKKCNTEIQCNNSGYENAYKTLAGNILHWQNLTWYNYLLPGGENLYGRSWGGGAVRWFIDVNGYSSGPNTLGKDLFTFYFNGKYITPGGSAREESIDPAKSCITEAYSDVTNLGSYMLQGNQDISGLGCSSKYLLE